VVLLLDRAIVAPPLGAAPVSVTVPVELLPPITVDGVLVNVDRAAGFTVRVALLVTPNVPEITTGVLVATVVVVIVKVAVLAPAATVMFGGRLATAELLLESVTTAPAGGAKPVNVTVPVDLAPPTSVAGASVTVERAAGLTLNAVVNVLPYVAEMLTEVAPATPLVVMAKVAVEAPAVTVTLAGTCAADVLLLERVTKAPPEGAAAVSVTVPVELLPPTTVFGLSVIDDNVTAAGGVTVKIAFCVPPNVPEIVT
jgi:hypothetical protein